jgi:uncharacterized membrane protein YedE/YeeE
MEGGHGAAGLRYGRSMRRARLASAALSAVGPLLVLVGIALTSGIGVAIVIDLGLVALAVVSVISGRRRRRDVAASSPSEQQETARNSYRIMRWSQVVILAAVPVIAVVLVVVGGVSFGTGLMLAGLAISTVLGVRAYRNVLAVLKERGGQ